MDLNFLPQTNWIDVIVAIFLVRGCYIGWHQGFSVELFKVLGALAAIVLPLLWYGQAGDWLSAHSFLSLNISQLLTFIVLVFSLLILFKVVRIMAFRIMHLQLFGNLEQWGGVTLGLIRSLILASLFIFGLSLLPTEYIQVSVEEKSLTGPYVKRLAPSVFNFGLKFKPKEESK